MKPVKMLIQEHNTIQKMVEILKFFCQHPEKIKLISLDQIIDFFRIYADKCHHGKEEKIFFEKLEKKALKNEDRILMYELIEEHKLARSLISSLEELKENKNIEKIVLLFLRIIQLYTEHIEKENKIFFLPAFGYFSQEETETILKEFIEVDQKIIPNKYLQVVENLENFIQT